MPNKHIFACDERGTTRWPSKTKTWAFGGFVFNYDDISSLESCWNKIKVSICGSQNTELKWSHFFPGDHLLGTTNPILTENQNEYSDLAIWAINKLFSENNLYPLNIVLRKDKASKHAFKSPTTNQINKEYNVVDGEVIWVGLLGLYASYLDRHNSTGEIWSDQLGSRAEEDRRNEEWQYLRNEPWPTGNENQHKLRLISNEIRFFNSNDSPIIQIADFVSGVIWAASEGDEEYLLESLDDYFPFGHNSWNLLNFQ